MQTIRRPDCLRTPLTRNPPQRTIGSLRIIAFCVFLFSQLLGLAPSTATGAPTELRFRLEFDPEQVEISRLPSGYDRIQMGEMGLARHEIVIASIPPTGTCTEAEDPCDLVVSHCFDWLPPEWRPHMDAGICGSPAVADVDGDGALEVILASPSRGVFIWEPEYVGDGAFTCQAELGWPLRLLEESTTPVIADVDNDQCLELLIGDQSGLLHLFDLPGACAVEAPWPMAGADPQRTHNFGNVDGFRQPTGPTVQGAQLLPAHPNPFNPSAVLRFQMPYKGRASVTVFNASGRRVIELYDGLAEAGLHEVVWDGR
ncbi:MAG: hypothetical protein GF346_01295, partial [Candidatus Eisenbacteria bacterium]|nr:hypothetical protein [Candidatus Latescibacterota bacterium]MBD3301065.1 hypothetical protein [Candidatus Eisenbacteria bacterium]